VEHHVLLEAEAGHLGVQPLAVGLTVVTPDLGVGGAEDDVEQVGVGGDDGRQGVDDVLDALVRAQQPEGHEDGPALGPDGRLGGVGVGERDVGHAVGDHDHLRTLDAIAGPQQVDGLVGQHHQDVRSRRHGPEGVALVGRRGGEHRVQRGDHGDPQVVEQLGQVAAGRAAEDAELVLDAHHVDVALLDELGCGPVVAELAGLDLEDHVGPVGVGPPALGEGHLHGGGGRLEGGEGAPQVVGEGGDAAAPGRRGADQTHPRPTTITLAAHDSPRRLVHLARHTVFQA
jgi:hypothetical protein